MQAISQGNPVTEITHFERMGLNGLSSNSLILTRGRKWNSLLVHAHYHIPAYSLFCFCFFVFFFYFLSFLLYLSLSCFVLSLFVHGWGPFYTACLVRFLLFYPLTAFVLMWVSFPDHPLVCQLPSHHQLPVLAMPHPIPTQRVFFCFLVHCGIPIRIKVGILSHYPSWHAPSDSNSSFPFLGGMSSQQNISPEFEQEPQNRLSPSPHRQNIPFLTFDPWPTTLVLARYKLVVPKPCAHSTSMCVHSLFVVQAFAMT